MKYLSRKEENALQKKEEEAYLQYYYFLRKHFEASRVNKLSLATRKRIHPMPALILVGTTLKLPTENNSL